MNTRGSPPALRRRIELRPLQETRNALIEARLPRESSNHGHPPSLARVVEGSPTPAPVDSRFPTSYPPTLKRKLKHQLEKEQPAIDRSFPASHSLPLLGTLSQRDKATVRTAGFSGPKKMRTEPPSPTHTSSAMAAEQGRQSSSSAEQINNYLKALFESTAYQSMINPPLEEEHVYAPMSPGPYRPRDVPSSIFHPFLRLPAELRERVYAEALICDNPIHPHLCNNSVAAARGIIKFHDDKSIGHNAIWNRLAITRTSKHVREESLPVFYSCNVFSHVEDTLTYFEHLSHLGRFHMIRRVKFPVYFYHEQFAARVLRDLHKSITEQEQYEKQLGSKKRKFDWRYATLNVLEQHPLHLAGGIHWIAPFLLMRKLSTSLSDPNNTEYHRELVLHIPTKSVFEMYKELEWFLKVAEGMGLKLKFHEGAEVKWLDRRCSGFYFEWVQKYQKTAVNDDWAAILGNKEQEKLMKKAKQMYPTINELPGPNSTSYFRRECETAPSYSWGRRAKFHTIKWYKMTYRR